MAGARLVCLIYDPKVTAAILTEDGEFVYFGPYMQYMSGVTDTQVKWILEYRSDNPGIRDGDMFLANDPWVGAAHQQQLARTGHHHRLRRPRLRRRRHRCARRCRPCRKSPRFRSRS